MAKYTTQVRSICEVKAGLEESEGFSSVDRILEDSWSMIFTDDWTTYDPDYKKVLCIKILRHYYTREISAETVGLWMLWLNSKMCEIMPYYNQLYKSAGMEYDPLKEVDVTTVRDKNYHVDKDNTRTDDLTERNEATSYSLYSDTPQGGLTGVDNEDYLTDITKNIGDSTRKNTGTLNDHGYDDGKEYELHTIKGKSSGKSYSQLIKEYRDTFINIDMMIIKELKDLFFNIY